MKPALQIICCTSAACLLATASAFSQALPVVDNLQRLVAQEDTDGDMTITIRDHTTPFVIRDENGGAARTLTNFL
jgi:hypothetical protein